MSMKKPALALALALTTLFAPLSADAKTTKTHTRTKIVGYTTVASWDYVDGDTLTFVSVVATENNLSGTGGKSTDAFVSLSISQSSISTGNVLITGRAEVNGPENFDFVVDRQLGTARLVVNDAIFQDDNSFTFFNVDIDLTWTATADAVESKSHDKVKEPGIKVISKFHGIFRDGVAQGSVFGKNIQFTPGPSTSAQLQFNKFGSIEIVTESP